MTTTTTTNNDNNSNDDNNDNNNDNLSSRSYNSNERIFSLHFFWYYDNKNANARTSHCMQKGGLGAGI